MNDYVSKPVQISELRRALSQWEPIEADKSDAAVHSNGSPASDSGRNGNGSPSVMPEKTGDASSPASPVDLESLYEVTSDKPEKIRRFISTYLKQAHEIINSLDPAIHNGVAKDVQYLAHKLGGASSTLGMMAIVPSLAQLEHMGEAGQLNGAVEAHTEARKQLERISAFLDAHLKTI